MSEVDFKKEASKIIKIELTKQDLALPMHLLYLKLLGLKNLI